MTFVFNGAPLTRCLDRDHILDLALAERSGPCKLLRGLPSEAIRVNEVRRESKASSAGWIDRYGATKIGSGMFDWSDSLDLTDLASVSLNDIH